jgi:hypothetical protein
MKWPSPLSKLHWGSSGERRRRSQLSLAPSVALALGFFSSSACAHGDFGPLVFAVLGFVVLLVLCSTLLAGSMSPPGQKGTWAIITLLGMPLSLIVFFMLVNGAASTLPVNRSFVFVVAPALFLLLWLGVFIHLFRLRRRYARQRAKTAAAALPSAGKRATASPRKAAAAPLTKAQKLGFGVALVGVVAAVGAFLFWPQLLAQQEMQAERSKAAKQIAAAKVEAEKDAKYVEQLLSPVERRSDRIPKFVAMQADTYAQYIGKFASNDLFAKMECFVTVTDPAGNKADEPHLVLFRDAPGEKIRAFARGFHAAHVLKDRVHQGQVAAISFFGDLQDSPSAAKFLGTGETSFPLKTRLLFSSNGYRHPPYGIDLQVTEPLKCDWFKPRCHATAQTNLLELPKAVITEHCANKSSVRFFPAFAYGK